MRADEASFAEYVTVRSPALLRTAYLLTGNHHDAEDLVQGSLIKVVARWRRIADHPDPYVRKVMVNEHISRWRGRRWRELNVDRFPDRGALGPDLVEREALRAALGGLAPRQRAVIVLRYFEDLTERETAEVLGIAIGTVKSQARDALARLRDALGEDFMAAADGVAGSTTTSR